MERNLEFYSNLYIGQSISPMKLDKIKNKLRNKTLLSGVHLVAVSLNPNDMLDVFDAKQLVQRYYLKREIFVVGIAGDYEEAIDLVEKIVQDCVSQRGDCSLKEFLGCCQSF